MGKKTGKSRGPPPKEKGGKAPKDKEEEEEGGDAPADISAELNEEDQEKIADALESAIDKINEKRGETREKGLSALVHLLQRVYCETAVEKRKQGLSEVLFKCAMKGASEKETGLALQALSLVAFTLGPDSAETFFIEYQEVLTKFLGDSEKPKATRAEAACCLASLAFIGCPDQARIRSVAQSLTTLFAGKLSSSGLGSSGAAAFYEDFEDDDDDLDDKDKEEEDDEEQIEPKGVREKALGAWTALVTQISDQFVAETIIPDHLPSLQELLHDPDFPVRAAAGEAIALLFDKARIHHDDAFDFHLFDDILELGVDALLDDLKELSQKNDRRTAKKAKVEQRRVFKEYCSIISEGTCDAESMTIKHQKFVFETFDEIVMLRFCRDVLGSGFQAHFLHNSLIHDIFNMSINQSYEKYVMTDGQKRMFMSPNSASSKAWTCNRKKDRKIRSNQKSQGFEE